LPFVSEPAPLFLDLFKSAQGAFLDGVFDALGLGAGIFRFRNLTKRAAIRGNLQSCPAALDGTEVASEQTRYLLVGPGDKQFVLLRPPFFAATDGRDRFVAAAVGNRCLAPTQTAGEFRVWHGAKERFLLRRPGPDFEMRFRLASSLSSHFAAIPE